MARVNLSFTQKYTAALDSKMRAQLADFANRSACAGIHNNKEAAEKARLNHHGAFSTRVPARRFITAATMDIGDVAMATELKQAIKEAVGRPVARNPRQVVKREETVVGVGSYAKTVVYEETRDVRGNVFGRSQNGEQKGPVRVLKRIADHIAQNQRTAIAQRAFAEGPDYKGDPKHNAPRVIKQKGRDEPLVATGAMQRAIKGWVE